MMWLLLLVLPLVQSCIPMVPPEAPIVPPKLQADPNIDPNTRPRIFIGARRVCAAPPCPATVMMTWQNGVSTVPALANPPNVFDASGDCLSLVTGPAGGGYDDTLCTFPVAYSCGQYADMF
ncbi:Ig-like domain-containing protein [Caenorhabditis elegans]|uniref:Ig-like domain-containing protein n=1 Tax=Caenorhabditis elegans TaxID=6239 RepID=Q56VX5_CAEEL|nr:Ig-like domain-containing protein [Caenorhabditis elegans]CAI79186.1 Ig-like domain-containing protein [Caenorhabditis elegans]|eukprot:NP_001021690.1 Uncharacterized protein CELE_Y105E8A.32 [Caenorhabditis elegans]